MKVTVYSDKCLAMQVLYDSLTLMEWVNLSDQKAGRIGRHESMQAECNTCHNKTMRRCDVRRGYIVHMNAVGKR
jgi:hypothetical protein